MPLDESASADTSTFAGGVGLIGHPDRIGPYRIVRPLGEGGMGVVYLAEQTEPVRREVAVKVLKMGLDTRLVVARFESERQALAVMEHPGITRVYDAGATDTGHPYFVMERVSGSRITEYADAHRLDLAHRVRLFIQVCRAVQHAHQKGIIHRDLKPSNILVTEGDDEPLCKVIDFGIAKATEPAADSEQLTMTGLLIGTPAYMSPEQASGSGLDIDTRSDIYSLGVVLYELLAGVLPFEPAADRGLSLIARHIAMDPAAPSARVARLAAAERARIAALRRTDAATFGRRLRGDLDWMVLKALEKERDRRYATANDFAVDLERFLGHEPVLAGPPGRAYRARKFVRRHRVGVAFATTVLVLLVGFSTAVTVQARDLARARGVAETRQGQAENLIGFMLGDLRGRLKDIGRLDLLDDVGKKAIDYFAAVPKSALSSEELLRSSQMLQQLGEVRVEQGNFDAARDAFTQALALSRELADRDPAHAAWQVGLGAAHFWVGYSRWRVGDHDGALAEFTAYLRISEALVAAHPDSLDYRRELGSAHSNIGSVKESRGDLEGALQAFLATRDIKDDLVRRDSANLAWRIDLAQIHNSVGVMQRKLGRLAEAETSHRAELALKRALVARDTANRQWERQLAIGQAYLASLLIIEGQLREARQELAGAHAIYARLVARDTSNAEWRRNLANTERLIGQVHAEAGEGATARRSLDSSRARLQRRLAIRPDDRLWLRDLAGADAGLAHALLLEGRPGEALAAARRAVAVAEPAVASRPGDVDLRENLCAAYIAEGRALARSGDIAGATASFERAVATVDSLARATRHTDLLAASATALLELGRVGEATPLVNELVRRGYRKPSFARLARSKGVAALT